MGFYYNEKDEIDNNYVNITFEFNGIKRMNIIAHRKELVIRYCKSFGIDNKYFMYFYKSYRLDLYKTIEENQIENNSLIIVIDSKNIVGC